MVAAPEVENPLRKRLEPFGSQGHITSFAFDKL